MTTDLENNFDRIYPLDQNTRKDVSEHQDVKIFWGSMPPDPPCGWPLQRSPDLSAIKKRPHDYL